MAGYYSANMGGGFLFNSTFPGEIVARVDFDGTTYAVDTPFADTSINPVLTGKTTAELLSLSARKGGFAGATDQSIYRKAGAAGATTVKLARVDRDSIVYCYIQVVTGLTSSARSLIVTTSDNPTGKIIPSTLTSALTGNNLIIEKGGTVGGSVPFNFYTGNSFLVSEGQDIELRIGAEAVTALTAGSINVIIKTAPAIGRGRVRGNTNEISDNRVFGSVYPIY